MLDNNGRKGVLKMKILIAVCIIILCSPVLCIGEEFKIPYRFEAGDEIKAQEFNQNYEAIETQINKLRTELDSLKSEMASIPSPSIVHTMSWNIKTTERGTATEWSNLPTEMALPITTGKSTLFITADISRIQHSTVNVNTEYRIAIEDKTLKKKEVAKTNTGNHSGWAFGPLTLHAATKVSNCPGGAAIRCKTQV
jgi:hypothetical protein